MRIRMIDVCCLPLKRTVSPRANDNGSRRSSLRVITAVVSQQHSGQKRHLIYISVARARSYVARFGNTTGVGGAKQIDGGREFSASRKTTSKTKRELLRGVNACNSDGSLVMGTRRA